MRLDDLERYFGSSYMFHKKTGMQHTNYINWRRKGFIPIKTQMRIEEITNGVLKADLTHVGRDQDDRARYEGAGRAAAL